MVAAKSGGAPRRRCRSRPTSRPASPPSARRSRSRPRARRRPTRTQDAVQAGVQGLRDQVLAAPDLVHWIEGEAKDQGIKITDAEVKKQFDKQKKPSFPKAADFADFLKNSGHVAGRHLTARQARRPVEQDPREGHQGQGQGHRRRDHQVLQQEQGAFAQPERRDLHVVLTKTEAKANEAKAALEGGQLQGDRQEVLDRPGRPSRRAASSPPSPRASRRRRSTTRSSRPRRASSPARSRPSSAATSSRSPRSPRP